MSINKKSNITLALILLGYGLMFLIINSTRRDISRRTESDLRPMVRLGSRGRSNSIYGSDTYYLPHSTQERQRTERTI